MAVLTTQSIVAAGTAPTFGAPEESGGDDYVEVGNGVNTFVVYKNTGTEKTVTLEMDHLTLETGVAYPDRTWTLAATTGELWIPLRKVFADSTEAGIGRCVLSVDDETAVTVAVVRVG